MIFVLFTVNEHYKGNRFRNQVVRQDFPTAVNEQNKEKENAERQAALYHQMINEQEEADAKVARQLAENLQTEADVERRRHMDAGEQLARRLHDKMVIQKKPMLPPPDANIVNELPIPPKKAAIKFNAINATASASSSAIPTAAVAAATAVASSSSSHRMPPMGDIVDGAGPSSLSKSQHLNAQLNYVSLELNAPRQNPSRVMNHHHNQTQYTQVMPQQMSNYSSSSPTGSTDGHHYERINLHSHTPEKKATSISAAGATSAGATSAAAAAYHEYNMPNTSNEISPPRPTKSQSLSNSVPEQYKLPTLPPKQQQLFSRHMTEQETKTMAIQKLSTEAFDYLMGNRPTISDAAAEEIDALGASVQAARAQQSCSPTRRDRYLNSLSNILGSANDIESYPEEAQTSAGNPERIRQLKELGVPVDEIFEIDRRITQEEKDEELARQLQAQERKTLTQEEKDHLVAMEAQDKELARMLQERV